MQDFPLWKRLSLWLGTIVLALAAVPSLAALTNMPLPDFLADAPQINLGLDLAGGSHILLEADPAQVAEQRLESTEETVRELMADAEPQHRIGDVSTLDRRLSFMLENPADIDRAREELRNVIAGTGVVAEWRLDVVDGSRIVLTQSEQALATSVDNAMESATEVVRRRIDALGTREPTIIRQGDTRIVVQVPGLQDPQALKELLGQTAELEFKLVDANALPSDIAQGVANPGSEIVPYSEESDLAGQFEAVRRLGGIRGDTLTNAQQSVDPQNNEPVVYDPVRSAGRGALRPAQHRKCRPARSPSSSMTR